VLLSPPTPSPPTAASTTTNVAAAVVARHERTLSAAHCAPAIAMGIAFRCVGRRPPVSSARRRPSSRIARSFSEGRSIVQSDVGVEFKGVIRWSSKASRRVGIESEGWAERDAGRESP
jgi:hypothetical protein